MLRKRFFEVVEQRYDRSFGYRKRPQVLLPWKSGSWISEIRFDNDSGRLRTSKVCLHQHPNSLWTSLVRCSWSSIVRWKKETYELPSDSRDFLAVLELFRSLPPGFYGSSPLQGKHLQSCSVSPSPEQV